MVGAQLVVRLGQPGAQVGGERPAERVVQAGQADDEGQRGVAVRRNAPPAASPAIISKGSPEGSRTSSVGPSETRARSKSNGNASVSAIQGVVRSSASR
jgi:hypothetical protein